MINIFCAFFSSNKRLKRFAVVQSIVNKMTRFGFRAIMVFCPKADFTGYHIPPKKGHQDNSY